VVIVSLTRDDLRDEFNMADEAFALSPISARAAQPSEQDYDAISEAFMETSRGRWFLGEYAKRNRNADTRMVLDAVERIEHSLAAQRQPQPAPESGLAEALAAIGRAVDEARAAASAAIDGMALEQSLAPVRKGARVIREIAWRLREIGADGRICDLIDSQVGAIEAGCGLIASSDPIMGLNAAFDLIKERIRQFDDGDAASLQASEKTVRSPAPARSDHPSDERAAAAQTAQVAATIDDPEAMMPSPALAAEAVVTAAGAAGVTGEATAVSAQATAEAAEASAEAAEASAEAAEATAEIAEAIAEIAEAIAEIAEATAEVVEATAELAEASAQAAEASAQAAEATAEAAEATAETTELAAEAAEVAAEVAAAHDDAVLEMVALEMAAPDPSDTDERSDGDEIPVAESAPAEPETIAPMAAAAPALQPSLGSTLIANGMVRRPNPSGPDPLAPIRRMSQAEKMALFS